MSKWKNSTAFKQAYRSKMIENLRWVCKKSRLKTFMLWIWISILCNHVHNEFNIFCSRKGRHSLNWGKVLMKQCLFTTISQRFRKLKRLNFTSELRFLIISKILSRHGKLRIDEKHYPSKPTRRQRA